MALSQGMEDYLQGLGWEQGLSQGQLLHEDAPLDVPEPEQINLSQAAVNAVEQASQHEQEALVAPAANQPYLIGVHGVNASNPSFYMEYASSVHELQPGEGHNSMWFGQPVISGACDPANIFTQSACDALVGRMVDSGFLYKLEHPLWTGGGRNGVRFNKIDPYVSTREQVALREDDLAWQEYKGYYSKPKLRELQLAYPGRGDLIPPKKKPNDVKINVGHLMWRVTHDYRKMPMGQCELSHGAEAAHNRAVNPRHGDTSKVEVAELESPIVNKSRNVCSAHYLHWRKPNNVVIPANEVVTYSGPTCCWHGQVGMPCYGPYPTGQIDIGPGPEADVLLKAPGSRLGGRSLPLRPSGGSAVPAPDTQAGAKAAKRGRDQGGGDPGAGPSGTRDDPGSPATRTRSKTPSK